MKNYYLFLSILFGISQVSFGQNNPPVAVDDTVNFHYVSLSIQDTYSYNVNVFLANDIDLDGDLLRVSSIIYNGPNYLSLTTYNGYIVGIDYSFWPNATMKDSFYYVAKEATIPGYTDTGMVIFNVYEKTYEVLDGNNITAIIDKNALFADLYSTQNGFEAPKNSGFSTIYTANLWVSGMKNGTPYGNIRTFGSRYWTNDPYFLSNSGPISNFTSTQELRNTPYDRVWKVKAYEIDYHLANWNSATYNPPSSFLDWPAHGDVSIGEANNLAPFFDYNNDGNYNPYDGDYPLIKGDQAIYFIYNDGMTQEEVSPMGVEIHGMAYMYQCQDSALQNTVFVDYRVINRSSSTYDNTYFGLWSDLDIGYAQDDYVQCDVDRGLYFGINGDSIDWDYGEYIPAQGVMTLQGAKMDNDGQDNAFGIGSNQTVNGTGYGDGISDNEHWGMEYFGNYSGQMIPITGDDYYNLLSGYDLNAYQWAADFLNTGTPIPFKYWFPGASDSYAYGTGGTVVPPWTEMTSGNFPDDRRAVSSSGPVTFAPGDEIELTYAFVFGMDYTTSGVQPGIDVMLERADSIRSYFNQGVLGACGFPLSTGSSIEKPKEIHIYPNPATDVITIQMNTTEASTIEIIDVTGKVVLIRNNQAQRATIDINNLPNGIYLVRVSSGSNMEVQKIVKQ